MASLIKRSGKWLSKPVKDPETGKRTTKQFDTQEEALAYEQAVADALSSGATVLPQVSQVATESNLRSIASATMMHRYEHRTKNTRRTMAAVIEPIVNHFGPSTDARQVLTRDRMTTYVNSMTDRAGGTRNQYRIAINAMVAEAAERGLVGAFRLKLEKLDNARDRFLTKDEEDRLMVHLPPDLRPLVRFTILTGLRLSEALAVRPEHVQGNVLRARLKGTKLGRIPLTDEAVTIIRQNDWSGLYFKSVQRSFKRAALQCGWKDVTFHTLRHTTASRLVQKGASLMQVKELLGHNSITTTQRYAHLAPDYGEALLKLLD